MRPHPIRGHRLQAVSTSAISLLLLPMLLASSCVHDAAPLLPSDTSDSGVPTGARLVARIVHVSDSHAVDYESPARFAGAQIVIPSAWRAWESSSTQLFDGIIRTINRIHASGQRVDFLLHTGDACDNAQANELGWFLAVMDGGQVNPLSGPDDRPEDTRPDALLDPYQAFGAQGLYQQGVHGDLPSIPWYSVIGNHESYCIGVFPILTWFDGTRVSPLPLSGRPGILLPTILDPLGAWTHGPVSPAHPGPPPLLDLPAPVTPEADRHFFSRREFIEAMFNTRTGPPGHGFSDPLSPGWYSVSPAVGLRLIVLDTADAPNPLPGFPYSEGAISIGQRDWLRSQLDASQARDELVIVASHHPSISLEVLSGSVLGPDELRDLLRNYPNVILHLAGHTHRNRVADRGGYIEIETCSTLDLPQEGRVVEIWRDDVDGTVTVTYHMFSSLDDTLPPLGDDPLRALRQTAHDLAEQSRGDPSQMRSTQPPDPHPEGDLADRQGTIRLTREVPGPESTRN
jgi:3',5'-cyclic AMP phosphodiesterase CpdA